EFRLAGTPLPTPRTVRALLVLLCPHRRRGPRRPVRTGARVRAAGGPPGRALLMAVGRRCRRDRPGLRVRPGARPDLPPGSDGRTDRRALGRGRCRAGNGSVEVGGIAALVLPGGGAVSLWCAGRPQGLTGAIFPLTLGR